MGGLAIGLDAKQVNDLWYPIRLIHQNGERRTAKLHYQTFSAIIVVKISQLIKGILKGFFAGHDKTLICHCENAGIGVWYILPNGMTAASTSMESKPFCDSDTGASITCGSAYYFIFYHQNIGVRLIMAHLTGL